MKKFLAMLLVVAMLVALVACNNSNKPADDNPTQAPETTQAPVDNPTEAPGPDATEVPEETVAPVVRPDAWARDDDEEVYYAILGRYEEMLDAAEAVEDPNERFVLFADAEAYLLSTGVMIPTTTQGGRYQIRRIAPRTVPYVMWGNDDDRLHGLVISDEFLTKEEYAELLSMWEAAFNGNGTYDPAGYLTGKGHSLKDTYNITFSTAPVTIDWLNTSSQSDTEITVNCVDGLVEYDNLNKLNPALAESWDVSDDGLTYTFHIRKGIKWYTSEGTEYAELTANDFVAGFHHMMDAQAGLEYLVAGVIEGVTGYLYEGGSFDEVGYKAADDYTLVVTLEKPTSYFMTMLTYSIFLPICDSFYQSRGGVYGIDEYAERSQDTSVYTFGMNTDVSSQVYCGPFLLQKLETASEILVVKNPNYYKADEVTLNSIKWVYDDGSNPTAMYNDCVNGVYSSIALTAASGLLAIAQEDGNFDKYAIITDTTSTSYFGGLNLNRGTFALESGACTSPKIEDDNAKIDTTLALRNKNFRLAMQYSFDKAAYNAVANGEDLKLNSLRNMYTAPDFVFLSADTAAADGHVFTANTSYGDLVQYFVTNKYNMPIDVHDGVNGWYHPEEAKACLEQAKAELGDAVNWPIQIDVVYLDTSVNNTNQAQVYKQVIEATLGTENVIVNLIAASTTQDFYACGYRARNGQAGNYDMFYGSGWGPDWGDPNTYLDTFRGNNAGYMTKVIGLF